MQSTDVIVVGDGIGAKLVIHALNNIGLDSITQIADDSLAPACSTRTTAINCLRGTRKGISKLGDLIVDSFIDFESFFEQYRPQGISKNYEIQSWTDDSIKKDQWQRRFSSYDRDKVFNCFKRPLAQKLNYVKSDAYIISPEVFFNWIDSRLKRNKIKDYVISINQENNQYKLLTHKGRSLQAKKVILCTSYLSKNFSHLINDTKIKKQLEHSKPVAGSYLRFRKKDFPNDQINWEKSFSFALDEIHFIYRKEREDILIGSTSKNGELNYLADKNALNDLYSRLSSVFEGTIDLPSLSKAQYLTGIRHKGQKRTPYWGEVNDGLYGVWGLYKNGFSFAFKAAKEISHLIQK